MNRRVLALASLALLVVLSGCAGLGGSAISQEQLAQNATYDWNTSTDVRVNATSEEYAAVYEVNNTSSLTFADRGGFGGVQPLSMKAVKFRYSNGTVVGSEAFTVSVKDSRTVVELPAENGKFAYTASSGSRTLSVPAALQDVSYEVVLPPGMRVDFPVFGSVNPGGYEKSVQDNRAHLVWESMQSDTIHIQYYLQRDLYIFGGLIAVLGFIALGGIAYFRIQIRRLERDREESGLGPEQ